MKLHNLYGIEFYSSEQRIDNMNNRRVNVSKNQKDTIERLAGNTNLDIGANNGYFSIVMAKKGKTISFEPHPNTYEILKVNTELYRDKLYPIIPFNCAIGDFVHDVNLYQCNFNDGMHRIYKSKYCEGGSIKVKMQRIDNIIFEKVDFIKIDVEGAEYGAFKGMSNILESYHPVIMFEFHPPGIREYGSNPKDTFDLLYNHGYREFTLLDKTYNIDSYHDIEYITNKTSALDIICI